jgi:hypothetical protein
MILKQKFAISIIMLLAFSTASSANPTGINGWWGFDKNGCNDTDNQYRVALGKWKIDNDKIKFGEGKELIGLYDGTCDLSDKKENSNKIEYQASCNLEGENYTGIAKIKFNNLNSINLTFPGSNQEGIELVRCVTNEEVKDKQAKFTEPSNKKIKYTSYKNSAAEFSIDVPQEILYPQGESGNHMGQVFKSTDMDAKLITYGEGNPNDMAIDDLYFDALNPDDKDYKVFTYKLLSDNWFVVTGYHNNNVFYKKTILSTNTGLILSFYFEYPKSKKSTYDDITIRMSKSFKEF